MVRGEEAAERVERAGSDSRMAGFEARLARFLDRVPEGTLVVDEGGKICLANASVAETFGYSPEELVGRSIEDLLPDAERDRHRQARVDFTRAPRDRVMGNGPVVVAQRSDGSCFHANIELRPRATPKGLMTLAVVRDCGEAQPGEEARLAREVQRRMSLVRLAAEDLADLSSALLSVLEGAVSAGPAGFPARLEEAQSTAYLVHELAEQLVSYGSEAFRLDPERPQK
jgi:PAS domain S-box-containing protein